MKTPDYKELYNIERKLYLMTQERLNQSYETILSLISSNRLNNDINKLNEDVLNDYKRIKEQINEFNNLKWYQKIKYKF